MRVQVRKILRPSFVCSNQRHFVFIALSWICHVSTILLWYWLPNLFIRIVYRRWFSDIPTRVCSRITNASSSTSSEHRYVIFGHELICLISANHIGMRQHRKGATSSNTVSRGLDLRIKDDSEFFHSIDSRHMVKNLCTSQEYFQWDIFLTFTCNMRKYFGTNPIRDWLDDNEW